MLSRDSREAVDSFQGIHNVWCGQAVLDAVEFLKLKLEEADQKVDQTSHQLKGLVKPYMRYTSTELAFTEKMVLKANVCLDSFSDPRQVLLRYTMKGCQKTDKRQTLSAMIINSTASQEQHIGK